MATDIHAEHVGSLLRQPWLLAARAGHKAGQISEGELRATEDRAAAENIAVQRSAGIRVFTDGEVRRTNWMTGILESIGGMSEIETPAVTWHRPSGEIPPEEETDFVMTAASAKVFQKDHLTAVEAAYMASQVPGAFKITMMSAAMGGMTWRPEVSAEAYPDPNELVNDLVGLQVAEVSELVALGARWVQLDSLSYNQVFDDDFRNATENPLDPKAILAASVAADAKTVSGIKAAHPEVTVGMHICRGNNRSAYMAKGGYEPVAEQLFGAVPVDRFLLEYDDERSGGFEPLRFVRPGRWSCSVSCRRRRRPLSPRTTCGGGSTRRPATCRWRTWPCRRSAGSRPPRRATCSPRMSRRPSWRWWSTPPGESGAETTWRRPPFWHPF